MSAEKDPMLGSPEEQAAYREKIAQMIQNDIEERRAQRRGETQAKEGPAAVIQGATGAPGSIIQTLQQEQGS